MLVIAPDLLIFIAFSLSIYLLIEDIYMLRLQRPSQGGLSIKNKTRQLKTSYLKQANKVLKRCLESLQTINPGF